MSEEFSLSKWLSDGVQGVKGAMQGIGGGLVPEEFRSHMKASRKEFLMAFRSLFDIAIEKVDAPKKTTRRRTTKMKVE